MTMGEKYVSIRGKTFLYKQKAPFVASGVSVRGAIEYHPDEDKLRCHECGNWFENLGNHVRTHGLTSRQYKSKHGLNRNTSLANEHHRIASSQNLSAWRRSHPTEQREQALKASAKSRAGDQIRGPRTELHNEQNRCPAQLLHRIKQIAARLGRTPTVRDLKEVGISCHSTLYTLNVTTLRGLMTLVGLVPNGTGRPHYSGPLLIELLRDFYVSSGRLPSETDFHRGRLPCRETFIRHFGNMTNAYEGAGLLKVAQAAGGN